MIYLSPELRSRPHEEVVRLLYRRWRVAHLMLSSHTIRLSICRMVFIQPFAKNNHGCIENKRHDRDPSRTEFSERRCHATHQAYLVVYGNRIDSAVVTGRIPIVYTSRDGWGGSSQSHAPNEHTAIRVQFCRTSMFLCSWFDFNLDDASRSILRKCHRKDPPSCIPSTARPPRSFPRDCAPR